MALDGRVNLVDQARVTIAGSVLRNAADNLLVVRGYSHATLVDCDLSGSSTTHPALYAEEGGTIVLRRSHLHDVPRDGAQVFDSAVLEVQDSRISSGGGAAARADRGGKILLTRSSIQAQRLSVIVAGYTAPIEEFVRSNPGLSSRFTRVIHFADYSPDELTAIFTARCHEADLELSADAAAAARELFARLHARRDAHFGNGRVARTQFETVIERQAARLMDDVQASTRVITAADIPAIG